MSVVLRPKHRVSGRVDPLRLALVLIPNIFLSLALGTLMGVIGLWFTYAIVMVPVMLTIPLAGLGYLSARWARLRNPIIAAIVGILLGATMYVGQYYTHFVLLQGPAASNQPQEFLPFVAESVRGQIVYELPEHRVLGTTSAQHWLIFGIEIGLCMLGAGFGWYIASVAPFCERCSVFMRRKIATLQSGGAASLALELSQGEPSSENAFPASPGGTNSYSRVEIVGCTHGGQVESADCFITAMDNVKIAEEDSLEQSALTPLEYQAVAAKYPQLQL